MKHKDEVFKDRVVALDGNQFYRCSFEGCVVTYAGGAHPFIEGCRFDDTSLKLIDEAWHVMQFLKNLHAGGLHGYVESMFNLIRGIEPPAKPAKDR
jgi:hypothetical protein